MSSPIEPGRGADADRAERERVAMSVAGQLRARGVSVDGSESYQELATLLEAADRFAGAVAARGGDSLTNAPDSKQPDRPEFVLPAREASESARDYAVRIEVAARALAARAD